MFCHFRANVLHVSLEDGLRLAELQVARISDANTRKIVELALASVPIENNKSLSIEQVSNQDKIDSNLNFNFKFKFNIIRLIFLFLFCILYFVFFLFC